MSRRSISTQENLGQDNLTPLLGASLNQKRAPLDIRAVAANAEIDWATLIANTLPPQSAWFILSTCNRFELYLYGPHVVESHLRALLHQALYSADHKSDTEFSRPSQSYGYSPSNQVLEHFDFFQGTAAAEHLCRVAAGLESKVFGESQILGQVIRAYEGHTAAHSLNHELDAVLRAAIRSGKRVRHETTIGANAGSIGSLAIQTVEARYRVMANATVAIVGLGEMGRLIARTLVARGASRVLLVNRTFENAQRLAAQLGIQAQPWERLAWVVEQADVVFSATAAQAPVITPALLDTIDLHGGNLYTDELLYTNGNGQQADSTQITGHPLNNSQGTYRNGSNPSDNDFKTDSRYKVLVDLAVPRDVDPAVATRSGLNVIDLDQLQTNLDESLAQRHAALPKAEQIIAEEMETLRARVRELVYRPLIVDLRLQAEDIRRQELAKTLRFIQDAQEGDDEIDPKIAEHIEHLSRALVNKILHEPTNKIRQLAGCEARDVPDDFVRELFGLPQPDPDETEQRGEPDPEQERAEKMRAKPRSMPAASAEQPFEEPIGR